MSMKLSVMRVADVFHVSTPELMRRYAGSCSAGISGMPATGSPRQIHTNPYCSTTWIVWRWHFGGSGVPADAEGTRTQRPSAPNVQPW
jgi:hypothetical protein